MRCARSLTSTNQPRPARRIADRFLANSAGVDTEGLPVDTGLAAMWLHLGDRSASDHYLSTASDNPHRRFWFFECQVLQQVALRHLLDGEWDAADRTTAEVERIGRYDPNFSLSSAAQRRWWQRETGRTAQSYATLREFEVGFPDFPVLRALLASDAAEAGFTAEAMTRLDDLAADDFARAGRGWLTLMALIELTWAAVTVNAVQHAPTLRRLLQPYNGQLAVMATGTHVVGAVDRFVAALAALEGHFEESDALYSQALEQERGVRSRPLEARTLHWWGRSLLGRGEHRRAGEHLERAHVLARDLIMPRLVQQIDQLRR
jgi:hypothetical protein